MPKRRKRKLKVLNLFKKKKTSYETNEPTAIDKKYIATLVIIGVLIFILGIFIFGLLISVLLTFIYGILMLLTQILDHTKKNSKVRKLSKIIVSIGLVFCIIGLIAMIIFLIYIVFTSPSFDVDKLKYRELSEVYDSKGKLITSLGSENRDNITYEDLPEVFVDALVATEDSRFFQHNGLDAPRFTKAVLGQLMGASDAGGGSTLTMQVSKNNFTSRNATGIKGIIRKFTDIYVSIFKIEKAYSKEQIIEFYVNEPFLGSNSYGVEQASQTYFGKSVSELNLAEASLIAGLFQAPTSYDPNANPENAAKRREVVLSLMVKHGYITQEEADIANSISVESLLTNSSVETNEFQGYLDTVIEEIVDRTGMDPYTTPMTIYTNMDREKQQELNKVFKGETYSWPNEDIQSGVVALESATGKIIAVGAGRNRTGARTYNYATDIKRQIGSTAKPLFDYGPAIEYNNWSTGQTIDDSPYSYSGGGKIENYDFQFKGKITLRYALSDSRNIPAIKAFQSVDNSKIRKFVETLGITPEVDSTGFIHEAHALGAFDGTSPYQLAGAYAAFSNGGYYREPYTVNKIILKESNETLEFKPEKVKAMSDSTAYMITNVLQDVAKQIGVSSVINSEVATKTGTTNYDQETAKYFGYPSNATPDGLIAGYTPKITLAMWTGFKENKKGRYITQSQMVIHRNGLYRACAKAVFDNDGATFTKPSSVVWATVERGSDPLTLASSSTPSNMKITELFKKGTEPTEVSARYAALDAPTGVSATYNNGKVKITWNSVNKPSNASSDFGEFGYNVYFEGEFLGFTTNNYYTYSTSDPYGTYTVKTAYKKTTSNMSAGSSYTISPNITFNYKGDSSESIAIGSSWSPLSDPIEVLADGKDVTSSAQITTKIVDQNGSVVSSIDTSQVGEYTVTYTAKYKGEEKSFTDIVTVS